MSEPDDSSVRHCSCFSSSCRFHFDCLHTLFLTTVVKVYCVSSLVETRPTSWWFVLLKNVCIDLQKALQFERSAFGSLCHDLSTFIVCDKGKMFQCTFFLFFIDYFKLLAVFACVGLHAVRLLCVVGLKCLLFSFVPD